MEVDLLLRKGTSVRCKVIASIALGVILLGCLPGGPISNRHGISFNNATYVTEIWASASCVKRGDTLHLRGSLTNTSSETRVFQAKDKPVFDIGVAFGDVKANWSDGRTLTPELTRLELKPGESKTIEMDWVITGTAVSGNAGAIFTYGVAPRDQVGANISLYVVPACPGPIGP
jgi:hypothetical protein